MSFTDQIHSFVGPGEITDAGDFNSVRGLHLRILESGKKGFYFRYRTRSGITRRPKIGDYPGTTLNEARKCAKILLDQVIVGGDPKGDWDRSKAELTVMGAFNEVFKRHWFKPRFIRSGRDREIQRLFKSSIEKSLGNFKLSELKGRDIINWHSSMSDRPTMANRALEVLNTTYTFSMGQEWCALNPCASVKSFTEKKRKRFANIEEIEKIGSQLWQIYENEPKRKDTALFLLALLYTGARPRSLINAKPQDLNQDGVLTFDGKSSADTGEKEQIVFPYNILILIPKDKPKLFRTVGYRGLWEKVCKENGIQDLWIRDLRRTFATIGLSNGISIDAIGEALNHKSTQTTKIYAKLFEESRIDTTRLIANKIDEILKCDPKNLEDRRNTRLF